MAASMDDVSKSLDEDQSDEISSSSEKSELAIGVNVNIHSSQQELAEEGRNEGAITNSEAKMMDSVTNKAAAGVDVSAERSETATPTGTASIASESTEISTSSGKSQQTMESCDSVPLSDKEDKPKPEPSELTAFKIPTLNFKPVKSNSKPKEGKAMLPPTEQAESESEKHDKIKNGSADGNNDLGSINAPSSSSPAEGESKGNFAFAMPVTLGKSMSIPKSRHVSFQGSQQQKTANSQGRTTDTSDKSKGPKADKDKFLQEKEKSKASAPPLPYKEPSWSGTPVQEYHLEVLKNGAILSKVSLNDKPFHVFGRLEACDFQLDHPSLSRYHMVLQYRLSGDGDHDPGFYVFDLGSTHGTFMNKQKLNAKAYYRMKVGHMFKLGGSTRLFILQGPSEDQEEGSELSITELKELRRQQMMQMEEKKRKKAEKEEELKMKLQGEKSEGIDWGMGADAGDEEEEVEEPGADNPFAMQTQEEREAAYIKDPKKTLRGFFEREDVELEYEVDEKGSGFSHQYICRVQLPIDDSMGNPIYAEATVSGKKKEAVIACALEACRILDAHGVLRQATHESKKRKAKDWAQDDFYDSDDDTFLDRTGAVEKKRKQRMMKAGVIQQKAETYDSLLAKLQEVDAELETTERQLEEAKKAQPAKGESDNLDDFIASLKAGGSSHDRAGRGKLKLRVVELRKEQFRLQKLAQVARPASMPAPPKSQASLKQGARLMVGSMKSKSNFKDKFKPKIQINAFKPKTETNDEVEEEEEEEEEDDDDKMEEKTSPPETTESTSKGEKQDNMETSDDGNLQQELQSDEVPSSSSSSSSRAVRGPSLPPSWDIAPMEVETKRTDGAKASQSSPPLKAKKVYGPARPPPMKPTNDDDEDDVMEEDDEEEKKRNKKGGMVSTSHRVYGPAMPPPASTRDDKEEAMREDGPEYSSWQPPSDQKGDGRTKLNEKLGY